MLLNSTRQLHGFCSWMVNPLRSSSGEIARIKADAARDGATGQIGDRTGEEPGTTRPSGMHDCHEALVSKGYSIAHFLAKSSQLAGFHARPGPVWKHDASTGQATQHTRCWPPRTTHLVAVMVLFPPVSTGCRCDYVGERTMPLLSNNSMEERMGNSPDRTALGWQVNQPSSLYEIMVEAASHFKK